MRTPESTDVGDSVDLEAVRRALRERPVELALLFGSRARGTTHSRSDVDIAVEFESLRPSDDDYNDAILGLGADLSDALGTDAVDIVDLRSASPALIESIFNHGVLLTGDPAAASALRRELTERDADTQSARDRLDEAIAKIDAHLDGGDDAAAAVTGESENDG